jgi:hypothetical protein
VMDTPKAESDDAPVGHVVVEEAHVFDRGPYDGVPGRVERKASSTIWPVSRSCSSRRRRPGDRPAPGSPRTAPAPPRPDGWREVEGSGQGRSPSSRDPRAGRRATWSLMPRSSCPRSPRGRGRRAEGPAGRGRHDRRPCDGRSRRSTNPYTLASAAAVRRLEGVGSDGGRRTMGRPRRTACSLSSGRASLSTNRASTTSSPRKTRPRASRA